MPLWLLILPLISFLVLLLVRRLPRKLSAWIGIIAMGLGLLQALSLTASLTTVTTLEAHWSWLTFKEYTIEIGYRIDMLSGLMLCLVYLVSLLVHLFSITYMQRETRYRQYFAYLGLFTAAMVGILLTDSLLFIYFFWELVGLSSYLLIGFWYEKPAAIQASKKAFMVNRVGDVAFLIGMLLYFLHFQTFQLSVDVPASSLPLFTLMGLCIFGGCMGKSAQFPLHLWLPDAMEGPTPVSAMIHAATMVAAGIYLLTRIFFLLTPDAFLFIAIIGTITTLVGALLAIPQRDIKKVLAYSTISQLGLMVLGIGVGAYQASLLHLFTHAFFKAGLFLSVGAIIHYLHEVAHRTEQSFDAQDMYLMGGLQQPLRFTFITYTMCMLALIGFPLFSGFLSKDAILLHSYSWAATQASLSGNLIYYCIPFIGFLSIILTAFYMGRQWYLVFWGQNRLSTSHPIITSTTLKQAQATTWPMRIAQGTLVLGALWLPFGLNPFYAESTWFWEWVTPAQNTYLTTFIAQLSLLNTQWHTAGIIVSMSLAIGGLGLAYALYGRALPIASAHSSSAATPTLYADKFLTSKGRWLSRLAQWSFSVPFVIKPAHWIAKFTTWIEQAVFNTFFDGLARIQVVLAHIITWWDRTVVDGLIHFVTASIDRLGRGLKQVQRGDVQQYLTWMIGSLLHVISWVL
ncbi:MAG: NADH-quinone oxidoreductase subunit L [Thermonemataceae bacterium]